MSDFSDTYYCQRLCPLFEDAGEEMPWRCILDCAYTEEMVLVPVPPSSPARRRTVPMYVKRDPREFYNAHPVAPWQYSGVITGDPLLDLHFPAGPYDS